MIRLAFCLAALISLHLAGCGPTGPTYPEALQMVEAEQQAYNRLDKAVDDLIIKNTSSLMARAERSSADRQLIDPNQGESEYAKKLAEIEARSAKEQAEETLLFKEHLSKAKGARDAQILKLDAAKKLADALGKSK